MKPPDDVLLRLAQGLLQRGLAPHDLGNDLAGRMAELDGTLAELQRGYPCSDSAPSLNA